MATVVFFNSFSKNEDKDLANSIAIGIEESYAGTVRGCDSDPNDKCYSSETGDLLAGNCDPSCGTLVKAEMYCKKIKEVYTRKEGGEDSHPLFI